MSIQDEILTVAQLDALVQQSATDAIEGRDADPHNVDPGASVLVAGGGFLKDVVRSSVAAAVRKAIDRQIVLSAPVQVVAKKLSQAVQKAEELRATIEALDAGLTQTHAPAQTQAVVPIAESHVQVVSEQPQVAAAVPLVAEPPASTEAPTVLHEEPIVVAGETVVFTEKTREPFKRFLRRFVEEIKKGPVRPSWAGKLARETGWNVTSQGTVYEQIRSYIGELSKWRDEKGDFWWSLPGEGTEPAGTKRFVR